ncbi:MAG: molybdopterin-dependent oxidoreductase [Dehalococcoidia bacterium]
MAITITLDGVEVSGQPGMTILELARESGIHIPTLCHDEHLKPYGACRICLVENEQNGSLLASCVAPIGPGMVINTRSEKVLEGRRTIVRLMLASHPDSCMVCDKGNRCQLRQIAGELGVGWIDLHRIPHPAEIRDVNPFIERDLSKCIMCAKCIRADQELVVEGAIDYFNRGFSSRPATVGDVGLELSECTFCGTCVAICPTGALSEKAKPYHGTTTKVVPTVCGFCASGCNLSLEVAGNMIIRARPADGDTPNGVTACVRGSYGFDYIDSPHRLTRPLVKAGEEFQPVSWEEAFDKVAGELNRIKAEHGPDSIAVIGSTKCTNEDNYILQRFAREVLETPNIDNGGQLYYSTSIATLRECLGLPASTNPVDDIELAEVILLVGADPEISAPLVGYAVKRASKLRNIPLISINPVETSVDRFASPGLYPKAGTESAVINGIIKTIIDQGIWNKSFVSRRTESFEELKRSLEIYNAEDVENSTGVTVKELQEAARTIAQANSVLIIYGPGVSRQQNGTDCVTALSNLALLTGNIGKEGAGILALLEENNAQGASDMGCLPDFRPGYEVSGKAGLTVFEMINQARSGKIKGMYIMGENLIGTIAGVIDAEAAFKQLDFLVVQDLFLNDTARLADVVFPASCFAEKDGTFTSFERRVQRVRRVVDPPGESMPDWQIIANLAEKMGHTMSYGSDREIMDEVSSMVPLYQGITYENLETGGIYWPNVNGRRGGTRRLYEERFDEGYGRFLPAPSRLPDEKSLNDYPFWLLSSRSLYRFGSEVRSTMSPRLNAMNPENRMF